jgi:hypothetical protein
MNVNQRVRFAGLLAVGATILLISILAGTHIGDHAIVAADGKNNSVAVDLPTPVPIGSASVPPSSSKWKKAHVVSVATDPAFPDPRFTPTPKPTPTPEPSSEPTSKSDALAPDAQLTDTPADAFPVKPTHRPVSNPVNNFPSRLPSSDELGE